MKTDKNSEPNTKERILDSAERLFATRGFKGTSVNRIASDAQVNQSAINYHFGSKMELINTVIDRRVGPINRQRLELMEAVRREAACHHRLVRAGDVLRAFIEPTFSAYQTMHERKYHIALVGRALWESDKTAKSFIAKHFARSFAVFHELMTQALPELPDNILTWRLHFTGGVITHCMGVCSSGMAAVDFLVPDDDLDTTVDLLLDFVTTGVCSPCPPALDKGNAVESGRDTFIH